MRRTTPDASGALARQLRAQIVLGKPDGDRRLAAGIGLAGMFAILDFHVIITWFSLRYRCRTQRLLGFMVDPFEQVISRLFTSRQQFRRADISPYHRVNGYPPTGEDYRQSAADGFRDYRLSVGGHVARPTSLFLADLRGLGDQHQITKHNCIQGWTAIAEWAGVPLRLLIDEVRPCREVRDVVSYGMDDKGRTEAAGRYGYFYGTIPPRLALLPQTIVALEMNGAPLPIEHSAPVRLRIETQLGFKMVMRIAGMEFVADVADIGMGKGGWREDQQFYANAAGI